MGNTPNYIKALLLPVSRKPQGRKVWSVDLEQVWLPFFTATNTQGDTAIPADAIGYPLRLAYAIDGSVKFSKAGRPVLKVAKDLSDSIRLVRDNFVAGLQSYAQGVMTDNADGYKAQLDMAIKAGMPIHDADNAVLDAIVKAQVAEQVAKAEAVAEAVAETEAVAEPKPKPKHQRELVTA